ncbi:MAG: hypothetical protein M1492_09175 [Gammaproteobacteria bacterium]|jgi:hypothetical protein|nr:hypothetical protein [Gammaproteobacteria bacterium]
MSKTSTSRKPVYRIYGITADGNETLRGRFSTLPRANKALDDLDFALFTQRDAGVGGAFIAYQIRGPEGLGV